MSSIQIKNPENIKELQKMLEIERREKELQEQKQKIELLKQWEGLKVKSERFGIVKTAILDRVKKDKVYLKRDENAKDSFSISVAEFTKFYRLDE